MLCKLVPLFLCLVFLGVSCGQLKAPGLSDDDILAANDNPQSDTDAIVPWDIDASFDDTATDENTDDVTDNATDNATDDVTDNNIDNNIDDDTNDAEIADNADTGPDNSSDTTITDQQIPDNDVVPQDCGNGTINGGEVCDGETGDCIDLDPGTYVSGTVHCLADCTGWDTSACVGEDQCANATKQCTDGTHYATCSDYDSDGYTEWSGATLCPNSGTCSGNGLCSVPCVSHFSYACFAGDVYYYDSCGGIQDKKTECGVSEYIGEPYCLSNNSYQEYAARDCSSMSCTEDISQKLIDTCTNGCSNGVCNPSLTGSWQDSLSGLLWQNTAISSYSVVFGVNFCENLSLDGYNDWRLPTISELRSLARVCSKITLGGTCGVTDSCSSYSGCYNASNCGSCTVGGGPSDTGMYWSDQLVDTGTRYWSSTAVSDYPTTDSWYVDFSTGALSYQDKNNSYSVRCVRGTKVEYCGDGETNGSEICDGNSATCESVLGISYTGTAYCAGDCLSWDTDACASVIYPPTNVSATDGAYSGYIRITWNAVTNAQSYYVYRATSETGSYSLITPSGTTGTSYDDPPPTKSYYFYKVASFNSLLGYSELSDPDSGWCY